MVRVGPKVLVGPTTVLVRSIRVLVRSMTTMAAHGCPPRPESDCRAAPKRTSPRVWLQVEFGVWRLVTTSSRFIMLKAPRGCLLVPSANPQSP